MARCCRGRSRSSFYYTAGGYLSLGTSALVMILLTLSLDLALGYAGIITLGHAAFFGFGAYARGIVLAARQHRSAARPCWSRPCSPALFAALTGMLILHTQGVTLLMLTLAISALLYEAANRAYKITGGDDGLQGFEMAPVLGLFRFDLWGKTAYLYALAVLFVWFIVAWSDGAFAVRPLARRHPPESARACAPSARRSGGGWSRSTRFRPPWPAPPARCRRRPRASSASTRSAFSSPASRSVMLVLGGTRRLYGAFLGAAVYVVVQDYAAKVNPFYWMFVIGGLLMATVLFLENGLMESGRMSAGNFLTRLFATAA